MIERFQAGKPAPFPDLREVRFREAKNETAKQFELKPKANAGSFLQNSENAKRDVSDDEILTRLVATRVNPKSDPAIDSLIGGLA